MQPIRLEVPSDIGYQFHLGRPYEPNVLAATLAIRPRKVIDVGAHIGNHTLYWAAHGIDVWAVEPNPAALAYLQANVARNALPGRVTVVGKAAGSGSGSGRVIEGATSGMALLEIDAGGDVEVIPIDDLGVRADLIKIDVEGGELDVLSGASGTLRNMLPAVVIECHVGPGPVAKVLAPLGYQQVGRSLAFSPTFMFLARPDHLDAAAVVRRRSAVAAGWRGAARVVRTIRRLRGVGPSTGRHTG